MREGLTRPVRPWSRSWTRLIRYRWRQATLVALLGATLSIAVLGAVTVERSTRDALRDSVVADHGGRSFVLQTGSEDVQRLLTEVPGVQGVADGVGQLDTDGASSAVTLRRIASPDLELGVLTAGRRAETHHEATVSESVAHDLSLGIGETATVRVDEEPADLLVVGITRNPADAADRSVVLVDPDLSANDMTAWLTDTDPYSVQALQPALDDRSATYRSTSVLSDERASSLPAAVATMGKLPPAMGLLLAALLATVLIALYPVARADVGALTAAGVSPARAWSLVRWTTVGCLVAGQLIGFVAVTGAVALFRDSISGLFGQAWLTTTRPYGVLLVQVVACVAGALVLRPLMTVATRGTRRLLVRRGLGSLALLITTTVGVLVWAGAWVASRSEPAGSFASYAPWGLAITIAAIPAILARLVVQHVREPASRAVTARFVAPLWVVTAAMVVTASATGAYAARATHDANANESRSGTLQPPGSYLVSEVPAEAAAAIATLYAELGGRSTEQYIVPNERKEQVRATGVVLLDCLERAKSDDPGRLPPECFPQHTYAPVNTVFLSASPEVREPLGDPGLIEDGRVGVLLFATGGGLVSKKMRLDAEPSTLMGGNMPGLVLPAGGPEARSLHLEPTGARLLALLDFGRLDGRAQARLRGAVSRLAPGAQVSDGTGSTHYGRERAVAAAAGIGGAAVVLLLGVMGNLAVAVGERRTLRVLVDLGARTRRRARLVGLLTAVPVVSLLLATGLTMLTASIAAVKISAPYGAWWVAPFAGGLVVCVISAGLLMRVPERVGE